MSPINLLNKWACSNGRAHPLGESRYRPEMCPKEPFPPSRRHQTNPPSICARKENQARTDWLAGAVNNSKPACLAAPRLRWLVDHDLHAGRPHGPCCLYQALQCCSINHARHKHSRLGAGDCRWRQDDKISAGGAKGDQLWRDIQCH